MTKRMPQYAHYERYGIAEPREFKKRMKDGSGEITIYQGACRCGWVGVEFSQQKFAEHDCEEHMRLVADEP